MGATQAHLADLFLVIIPVPANADQAFMTALLEEEGEEEEKKELEK